jgi:nicotinamide-nucleotide amidase
LAIVSRPKVNILNKHFEEQPVDFLYPGFGLKISSKCSKILFSQRMRKACIISIGNELLIGDTVNTNASVIGAMLTEWGFRVEEVLTIPDNYQLIMESLKMAMSRWDLTITTGGLGPTHDDITKKAVADILEASMVEDQEVLNHIRKIFERRNFTFSRTNAEQALIPEGCEVLFNNKGTAPGLWFRHDGNAAAVLPGVPHEMNFLMENRVLEKIKAEFPGQDVWATRYLKTSGVPESTLSEQIGDLTEYLSEDVGAAFLPGAAGVTIRISANASDREKAEKRLDMLQAKLYEKAGDLIWGEGRDLQLSEVVGELLVQKNLTLAAAESCTGGLLSNRITDIPGSSRYMKGGIVAYANDVKVRQLGVNQSHLEKYGAVSAQVAIQMAAGVSRHLDADIGVSTTGIAGPGGGTPDKPVGTVWMGFRIGESRFALKAVLTNDRLLNKERTVTIILETIRRSLLGLEGYPYQLKPVTL